MLTLGVGIAFVMVTHDAALAERCDRVTYMKAGRLGDAA